MAGRKPNLPRRSSGLRPIHAGKAPVGYGDLLEDLKARIRAAQVKAALSVNRELIALYWHVGRSIVERQRAEGWGKAIVERLSADLGREFPGVAGFSAGNVWRMRAFYLAWTPEFLAQPARETGRQAKLAQPARELGDSRPPEPLSDIPWFHNVTLVEKLKDPTVRLWYARQTVVNGWSRTMLAHWIESDLHARQGKAVSNFKSTLPAPQSDLATEVVRGRPPAPPRRQAVHRDHPLQDPQPDHRRVRPAQRRQARRHRPLRDQAGRSPARRPQGRVADDRTDPGWACRPRNAREEEAISPAEAEGGRGMNGEHCRQAESAKLDAAIAANLKELGYGG